MPSPPDALGQEELQYFGKVSASISHELKNVLAILNENAGLLQDFAAMAEQGQPLDPDRIRRLAGTMLEQIDRGDVIIKRRNRFAHSADEPLTSVELNELVSMVITLFGRTAANRGVKVELKTTSARIDIQTDPFALETLLGSLLYRITERVTDISTISIEPDSHDDKIQIKMAGLTTQENVLTGILDSKATNSLLATLQASTELNQKNELVITLPGKLKA